jgi:lipoyl(octanoyl) transferase
MRERNGGGRKPARAALAAAAAKLRRDDAAVRWEVSPEPVPYPKAMARMDAIAAAVAEGVRAEHAWLLEHPPLITAGTSARDEDLLNPGALPVYRTGRGGQLTWHGPGQRVAYLMLDLKARGRDVRAYVSALEQWLIDTLADFGIRARREEALVGVWVDLPPSLGGGMAKIAAIGVRVSRGVTRHGVALNVHPDLSHYRAIVPCGVREHGVTSMRALGVEAAMDAVDAALARHFRRIFGPLTPVS